MYEFAARLSALVSYALWLFVELFVSSLNFHFEVVFFESLFTVILVPSFHVFP